MFNHKVNGCLFCIIVALYAQSPVTFCTLLIVIKLFLEWWGIIVSVQQILLLFFILKGGGGEGWKG